MKTFIIACAMALVLLTGCSSDTTDSFDEKSDMDQLVIEKVAGGETASSQSTTVTDEDKIAEILQKGEGLGAEAISGREAEQMKKASGSYYSFRSYQGSSAPVYSILILEDGTFLVSGTSGVKKTTDTHQPLLDDMKQLADVDF